MIIYNIYKKVNGSSSFDDLDQTKYPIWEIPQEHRNKFSGAELQLYDQMKGRIEKIKGSDHKIRFRRIPSMTPAPLVDNITIRNVISNNVREVFQKLKYGKQKLYFMPIKKALMNVSQDRETEKIENERTNLLKEFLDPDEERRIKMAEKQIARKIVDLEQIKALKIK